MKTTEHGIEDSKDVENMHHMRLMTLLQELVRDKAFKGAAARHVHSNRKCPVRADAGGVGGNSGAEEG